MTDQSHTPLPWQACGKWVCEENDPGHNVGICICEKRATEAETLANAELIVRSVNSLPSLIKALEEIAARAQGNPDKVQCLLTIDWVRRKADDALSAYRGEGK